MPVSDILQKMRMPGGAQQVDSQGLQQPAFDPIQLIAGLLGPALMRGMLGAGAGALGGAGGAGAEAAPEGFSQADMLAARLRAGARQRAPMMQSEKLAQPLHEMYPDLAEGINPMRGGRGVDLAESAYKVPDLKNVNKWTLGPDQEALMKFGTKSGEQFYSTGPSSESILRGLGREFPNEMFSVEQSGISPVVHDNTGFLRLVRSLMQQRRN